MAASSSTAASSSFGFCEASPSPMLRTIFVSRGTAIVFVQPRSRMRAGTRSLRYRSCSRDSMSEVLERFAAAAAHTNGAGVRPPVPEPRRLVAARTDRHDVRAVDGGLLLDHASCLAPAARFRVRLAHVPPLDDPPVTLGQHAQHLSGLAALPAGDAHDGVVSPQATQRHAQSTSGASEMIFMNFL